MDTSASLRELREEDLDTVSAGRTLHFGKLHHLHLDKLHFGNNVVQTNVAVNIGLVIGGSLVQVIGQSNFL
jgi:hypothetical protein